MMRNFPRLFQTLILGAWCPLLLAIPAFAAEGTPLWQTAADEVYLQESVTRIQLPGPIEALALHGEQLYAIHGGALQVLKGQVFELEPNAPTEVTGIWSIDSRLWAAAQGGLYVRGNGAWEQVSDLKVVDMTPHLGNPHAATVDAILQITEDGPVDIRPEGGYLSTDTTLIMEDGTQIISDPIRIGPIQQIASYSGTLYILRPGQLALLDGPIFQEDPLDWGVLPSTVTRGLHSHGSRLFIPTDRGLAVVRGMAVTTLTGADGLPSRDTTCVAAGFENDLWIGTTTGLVRHVNGEYQYFGADHWLPGDHVRDIAVGTDTVYAATSAGLSIIQYEPYTMLKKAAYYERQLEQWGFKRLGFIHRLYWAGDETGWLREISDNDGGHTAHYLAAMSFKYAATGDETAREAARDAAEAMIWLEDITPDEGFFARAIWAEGVDEGRRSERGSGGLPAKWYTTDDGKWSWKGDTSSDEVNAHFYAVALFHDLAAKGAEKARAAEHLARITRHIIRNGWLLRDMDGQPTRWGRWDPDYLLRPYGYEARGLNGMEAQSYVVTAHALTGDDLFQQGLDQLIEWGYHKYTVRQKLTFPPDSVVPWDDELAFRSYHPLLTYTHDPWLRSIYLRSLERHWEVMRMQQIPYFNFMYGALTGNDCEVDQAVNHLRAWPMDPVNHSFRNSHREDLAPEPGYVPYGKGTRAVSPREMAAMWGSRSAVRYDGGSGGRGAYPAVGWLEDYWMGRFYGMIAAPTVKDHELISVPPAGKTQPGAKAYTGPDRPGDLLPPP